jgi:hypothetical protein
MLLIGVPHARRLQLNAAKTDIMGFRSHANLQKIATQDLTPAIDTEAVQPVPVVCNLRRSSRF